MKNPTTIGFITRLYRMLIDHYERGEEVKLTDEEVDKLLVLFNRGFTEGYLFNQSGSEVMNINSPNHIGTLLGEVIDVNKKRIRIKLFKSLNQEDGIRFENEQEGMIANFIYDKNDKLISSGDCGDIIELDNKIGITTCGKVLKTVDSKLILELEKYQEKKIPISMFVRAHLGEKFEIKIYDDKHEVIVEEEIIEKATGSGTSKERILEQLMKLGDTPFILKEYDLDVEDGIFIPISKINELRRDVVSKLIEIRENEKKKVIINEKPKLSFATNKSNFKITALVRNLEQLKVCLEEEIDTIYVTDYSLYKEYSAYSNVYYRLDRVMNNYREFNNEKLLVGEVGSIFQYSKNNQIISDYYLNVGNSYHIDYLKKCGVSSITLSIENSIDTISSIVSNLGTGKNLEILVYGKVEAMIMKYCPLKMLINHDKTPCNICKNNKRYELKDRNAAIYPIKQSNELTHIFYHKNLDLTDKVNTLKNIGIERYRLELFDEKEEEVRSLIKNLKTLLS